MSKYTFWMIVITFILSGIIEGVEASTCPTHSVEQQKLIKKAYNHGLPHDLGYTLAAIAIQESFVGKHIVRLNNKDGKYGSYGVTHILLETAMYLEGYSNTWRARAELVPKLIGSDEYSMDLSISKLNRHKERGWIGMVRKYNGVGKDAITYGDKVTKHVSMLKKCYIFH